MFSFLCVGLQQTCCKWEQGTPMGGPSISVSTMEGHRCHLFLEPRMRAGAGMESEASPRGQRLCGPSSLLTLAHLEEAREPGAADGRVRKILATEDQLDQTSQQLIPSPG